MKPTADELLERYADAASQDTSRPSARAREAIRTHASMLAQARAATPTESPVPPSPHAANQSRWAVSLLASLAVVGLSTLLMLQMDRGSPDDREVAMGTPKPAHTAPQRPATPATASVATADAPAPPPRAALPAPTPVRAEAVPPRAGNATEADRSRARESVASPPVQETHPQAQRPGSAQGVLTDSGSAPAMPAAPPAPVLRADSVANMTLNKATAPATGASTRAQLLQAAAPTVQFLDAVRNGQIAIAEALVQQGQSVNSRDDKGDTALMVAVTYRQAGMAVKLLTLGADRQLVNRDGFTALDIARRLDLPDLVQLLQAPQ